MRTVASMPCPRFSTQFALSKSLAQLDFVDIPLTTDVRLFVDPYVLKVTPGPLFVACNNLVVHFFQHVVGLIRSGRKIGRYGPRQH